MKLYYWGYIDKGQCSGCGKERWRSFWSDIPRDEAPEFGMVSGWNLCDDCHPLRQGPGPHVISWPPSIFTKLYWRLNWRLRYYWRKVWPRSKAPETAHAARRRVANDSDDIPF